MTQKRKTLFTNQFKLGQTVSIIRHDHGWEDGRVTGKISAIDAYYCEVKTEDGSIFEIHHPRDIR